MASDAKFVSFIIEQMRGAGPISSRKMFGEYAIYCGEKVVALVCDNQLFVKPTGGGRELLNSPKEAPPYPGAKPHFLMDDGIDDPEALSELNGCGLGGQVRREAPHSRRPNISG
jgi:TfoX/Sxy family transcriptional regulator of competence genes